MAGRAPRCSPPSPPPTLQPGRRAAPARALPQPLITALTTLADAAPGDVDAPVGAVVVGALVVTAASLLIVQGLKPGTDAAEKIFDRDSKTGRRR